jgi:hypothetical protein
MKIKTWSEVILESTKFGESPARYYYWASLIAIAATMGKRVWLDRHYYKLYPNIFVLLISARSGLRKGVPSAFISRVLKYSQTARVMSGQNSIQGIIKELGKQFTMEDGRVINEAQALIATGELASAMIEDRSMWTTLTELYNTFENEPEWRKTLSSEAQIVLKNPCINFFGASNEALFESAIQSKDIEGGFIARTFIVHESKRRNTNSLVEKPEGLVPVEVLAEHLKKLSKVSGEFRFDLAGGLFYDLWYRDTATRMEELEDKTGTVDRLGDSVLKAAMLIALSRLEGYDDLTLTQEILEEAVEQAENCVPGTQKISGGQGQSELASATFKVMKLIIDAPGSVLSRRVILKKLWPHMDSINLDRVIETLKQSGAIDEPYRENKDIMYAFNKDRLKEYQTYKRQSA